MASKKHSGLGPSSAHRWLNCTPSAKLEQKFPDRTSEDAETGTLAHAIVEERLGRIIKGKPRGKTSAKYMKNPLYFPGMDDFCDQYVDYVMEIFDSLEEPVLYSEKRVDFSEWVPDGFGTTDTVIIASGNMYVFDFKFGKGVPVSAVDNPQLRLYALGAYNEYSLIYDIDNVVMTIVQPRIADGITTDTITVDDLLAWAETYVKPKAQLAAAGRGDAKEGDWCRFCKAKSVCKPRALAFLKHLEDTYNAPMELSSDELAKLLPIAKHVSKWASELDAYMSDQAINHGVFYPGYKIVAGRANRVIKDPAALAMTLSSNGYTDIYDLKGVTELESIVGARKLADLANGLIEKPVGKPTLVPDSDPRPAYNMFNDEEEENTVNG